MSIWELFVALFRRTTEDEEAEERSRFVPSPLDLSVRVTHGGQDDEIERELSKIGEQAKNLEDNQCRSPDTSNK